MTEPIPFLVSIDLPGDVRRALSDLRRDLRDEGVRWVSPEHLSLWLVTTQAPSARAADAIALATRRRAGQTSPFNVQLGELRTVQTDPSAPLRLVADAVDAEGHLERLATALRADLVEYGFEVADVAPCVPLGRCERAPTALPRVRGEIKVTALRGQSLLAAANGALCRGAVELTPRASADRAAADTRDRQDLDQALKARLDARPRPAAPRIRPLLAPTPRRPQPDPTETIDTDDDTTEGESHESDEQSPPE